MHLSYWKHPNIALLLQALLWCQVFLQGFHIVQVLTLVFLIMAGQPTPSQKEGLIKGILTIGFP